MILQTIQMTAELPGRLAKCKVRIKKTARRLSSAMLCKWLAIEGIWALKHDKIFVDAQIEQLLNFIRFFSDILDNLFVKIHRCKQLVDGGVDEFAGGAVNQTGIVGEIGGSRGAHIGIGDK